MTIYENENNQEIYFSFDLIIKNAGFIRENYLFMKRMNNSSLPYDSNIQTFAP